MLIRGEVSRSGASVSKVERTFAQIEPYDSRALDRVGSIKLMSRRSEEPCSFPVLESMSESDGVRIVAGCKRSLS